MSENKKTDTQYEVLKTGMLGLMIIVFGLIYLLAYDVKDVHVGGAAGVLCILAALLFFMNADVLEESHKRNVIAGLAGFLVVLSFLAALDKFVISRTFHGVMLAISVIIMVIIFWRWRIK